METFIATLRQKFEQVLTSLNKYNKDSLKIDLSFEKKGMLGEEKLFLIFKQELEESRPEISLTLAIPIPYLDENKNNIIGRRVKRAVGSWHVLGQEMDYWRFMAWLLTENLEAALPELGKRIQMERLVSAFSSANSSLAFKECQNLVNRFINDLPLAGTAYEAWAMCQRVVFLDPLFEQLKPKEALEYQKDQNKKFFPWTSLGLSDSSMVNNYLLKADLRKYTPFGIKHHNPKRNLYQTLGMRGDETPVVLTKSAKELAKQGVERTGYNLMTCFLDLPLNFEDQLILDLRHLDKFTCEERRFISFGQSKVAAGDEVVEGDILSIEPDGKEIRFWVKADSAVVSEVCEDVINFNGGAKKVQVISVRTKHLFKEGIKLTNSHGNKGVAVFADCGTMFDEGRQEECPIDIIVSAKTIGKRKNYGQVLECLLTLLLGKDKERVISDDLQWPEENIRQSLEKKGYAGDGTSRVKTQWGEFRTICGWAFWGVIKNPESQLWGRAEVMATNNRQLRTAGLKISHIELKALMTIFGPKNPVVEEILSYQQGVEDVVELVDCISILEGASFERPVISWRSIKPLLQKDIYFHEEEQLKGTIADADLFPEGFALELPRVLHIFNPDDEKSEPLIKVLENNQDINSQVILGGQNIFLDKILVPSTRLRNSWQHPTGLWGMSDIAAILNTLIATCHRLETEEADEQRLRYNLERYFTHMAQKISSKSGELATYALSVRYPHSAKATATLAKEGLPLNTIEIHRSMAENLRVTDGDYLIAERFPCLGFKSIRIQQVKVSDDEQCRNVIRVSQNSLVSQNLDFDGDVLFLMSFQTEAAKQALANEFLNPDKLRQAYLDEANAVKQPSTSAVSLKEVGLSCFPELTPTEQAEIVGALTGVKRGTGSAVALSYNLMRIIEGCVGYQDKETNLAMEVILDKVANSVFSQKHAGQSLEEQCKAAVCQADLEKMLEMGFPLAGSRKLCEIIKAGAEELGVLDLQEHFRKHLEKGSSNIINLIVRKKHKVYFATRSSLHPVRLLQYISAPPTDLVSYLWYKSVNNLNKDNTIA